MRSFVRLAVPVFALVGAGAASAAEYSIDIKSDLEGKYFVVEKGGTANNPTLLVKRAWPKGSYFIKRWFDCKNWTHKILGEGETLEAMNKSEPEVETTANAEGTIPDQLARHVCPPPHPGRP